MSKRSLFGLALLFAACGGDSGAYDGPCTGINGRWDVRWRERTKTSSCNTGDFGSVVSWTPWDPVQDAKCTGSITESHDGCEITWDDLACPQWSYVDGGSLSGVVRYTAANHFAGVLSIKSQTKGCVSVYDVSASAL